MPVTASRDGGRAPVFVVRIAAVHRVLVIEDDEPTRALVKKTLAGEQFEVLEAADGETALDVLRSFECDLVVLDWRLPGIWGNEVLDEIRARSPQVPVIVLTAETGDQTKLLATYLGANVFLKKPYKPQELLDAIEELGKVKRARSRLRQRLEQPHSCPLCPPGDFRFDARGLS